MNHASIGNLMMIQVLFSLLIPSASFALKPACQQFFLNSLTVQLTGGNQFSYSDSLVTVSYDFWSKGGKMSFSVKNESEEPIILDLTRSSFINRETVYPYFQDRQKQIIKQQGVGFKGNNVFGFGGNNWLNLFSNALTYSESQTEIITEFEKERLLIPPGARIDMAPFVLNFPFINLGKDTSFIEPIKIDSLMFFRNYLCIIRESDQNTPNYLDHDFSLVAFSNRSVKNEWHLEDCLSTNQTRAGFYQTGIPKRIIDQNEHPPKKGLWLIGAAFAFLVAVTLIATSGS